jgi:uncharacterized protein involved in outer membrane biogenesis
MDLCGLSNLGPIIKKAVNTYGPEITKTEVRLDDVGISIFSGEAKLKNFYLGNPKGFKSPQAMNVRAIYVDVNERSITGDTIIIDRIEVVGPEINYEKKRGTDNFKSILNNVQSTANTGKSSKKQPSKEGEGKKLLIRNFIVRDGKVDMAMALPGDSSVTASASLPDIHLKDVGQKQGGASPEEVFKEVFAALYAKIASPAVTATLNKELKALTSSAGKMTEDNAKELGKTVDETVKGLFGKSK